VAGAKGNKDVVNAKHKVISSISLLLAF